MFCFTFTHLSITFSSALPLLFTTFRTYTKPSPFLHKHCMIICFFLLLFLLIKNLNYFPSNHQMEASNKTGTITLTEFSTDLRMRAMRESFPLRCPSSDVNDLMRSGPPRLSPPGRLLYPSLPWLLSCHDWWEWCELPLE